MPAIWRISHGGEDSPGRGYARPPLRLRRKEGEKNKKMELTLFAALAGERVGQRSVAGASRGRRSSKCYGILFRALPLFNIQCKCGVIKAANGRAA